MWAVQREIRHFWSWYTLPRAQNFKPKFEFQTLFARNYPAGTFELIPFGANSDLRCNFPAGTLELLPVGANSDIPWDWEFPESPSCVVLFTFAGTSELFTFGANSDICWNFPAGISGLITFGASLDLPWDLEFSEIPSRWFLFAFPHWGLICLSFCGELHVLLLGFYYASPLLGNYINHQRTRLPTFPLNQSPDMYS